MDRESFIKGFFAAIKLGRYFVMGLISKFITRNGTYIAANDGADGYSTVTVDVTPEFTTADEGKVVENGALVAQTSLAVTENGTYDTTTNDEVVVYVSAGGTPTGTNPPNEEYGIDGDIYLQKIPLASGVRYVEYLQSSGTQYIDTGIIANQYTGIVVEFLHTAGQFILGARTSVQERAFNIGGNNTSSYVFDVNTTRFTISHNANENAKLYFVTGDNPPTNAFTTPYSIILFGLHSNTITKGNGVRIKRVTLYQKYSPIADYISCLDADGVPCMWENISGEYVYNDGTGSFTAGGDITPSELPPITYRKENGAWVVIS